MITTAPAPAKLPLWQPATWADYEQQRDRSEATSKILNGLPIALLEQTLDGLRPTGGHRLTEETNITAAQWFMKTLA